MQQVYFYTPRLKFCYVIDLTSKLMTNKFALKKYINPNQ